MQLVPLQRQADGVPLPQLRQCQRRRGLRNAVPETTPFQIQFSLQLTTAVLKACTSQRPLWTVLCTVTRSRTVSVFTLSLFKLISFNN